MEPDLLNVPDYAGGARAKLPKDVLGYYEGGALDEITLRENTAGWDPPSSRLRRGKGG